MLKENTGVRTGDAPGEACADDAPSHR